VVAAKAVPARLVPQRRGGGYQPLRPVGFALAANGLGTRPSPGGPSSHTKDGGQLIGKLEGPTTVTDLAKFAKTFKEAPQLAELVKAGKLPSVKERIGEDPLVIKPVHEIGRYGGTIRRGFTGPGDWSAGVRFCGNDSLVHWDMTGTKPTPLAAKSWQFSDGDKTLTIHLRRGMKWSDGKPFTADDFVFWFEDLYKNKDLVPSPSPYLTTKNGPAELGEGRHLRGQVEVQGPLLGVRCAPDRSHGLRRPGAR